MLFFPHDIESQFKSYLPKVPLLTQKHTGVCNLVDAHSLCPTTGTEVNIAIPAVPGCDGE